MCASPRRQATGKPFCSTTHARRGRWPISSWPRKSSPGMRRWRERLMPKQRFGLGRGLDALIPGATAVSDDVPMDTTLANSALFEVPTVMISPNPLQPRMPLDDPKLGELVKSIEEFGLLQPLLVRLYGEDEQGSH